MSKRNKTKGVFVKIRSVWCSKNLKLKTTKAIRKELHKLVKRCLRNKQVKRWPNIISNDKIYGRKKSKKMSIRK